MPHLPGGQCFLTSQLFHLLFLPLATALEHLRPSLGITPPPAFSDTHPLLLSLADAQQLFNMRGCLEGAIFFFWHMCYVTHWDGM